MLHTLNLYTAVCQFYLKIERKKLIKNIYSRYKLFISYMIFKYFSQSVAGFIYFFVLLIKFSKSRGFSFDEVSYIPFSFVDHFSRVAFATLLFIKSQLCTCFLNLHSVSFISLPTH